MKIDRRRPVAGAKLGESRRGGVGADEWDALLRNLQVLRTNLTVSRLDVQHEQRKAIMQRVVSWCRAVPLGWRGNAPGCRRSAMPHVVQRA